MGNNTEGSSLDHLENLTTKADALCDELTKLTGEDSKDSKIRKGIVSKARSTLLGAKVTTKYLQILDGVTFEPVLSYKVSSSEYPDEVLKASQIGMKVCNVLQNLSFLSKTAALIGYPIPDISEAAGMAKTFLSEIGKSHDEAEFVTSLNSDGGGFENAAELDEFKTFLDSLVTKGKLRFFRNEAVDKGEEMRKKSWEDVMMQTYFKLDGSNDSHVTWIDKENSGIVENYRSSS